MYSTRTYNLTMKSSWLAAAGVTLVLVLWMASGLLRGNDESGDTAADEPGAAALMRVEVLRAEPQFEQRSIELRGEVAAARVVNVRAETSGRVIELAATRGARVQAADVLGQLDLGTREALLRGARAQLASAEAELSAAESLGRRGLQSQLQSDQARAAAQMAQAEVDRLSRDLAQTQLLAPIAGVIEALPIEVGQLVERGDPIATLVDDSAFKVTARAAQQIAMEIQPGQPATVTLITGEELRGEVSWVSSMADAATRSFAIEARIDNPNGAIAAGASASLTIPIEEVEAVFLSPSALALSESGDLGVKVLDADDRVEFLPVSVLRTSLDGAWVTGIAAGTRIVTLGQGFVRVGEQVIAELDSRATAAESAQ